MSRYNPEFLTQMKREPMTLNFIKQAIEDKAILEAVAISCSKENTLTVKIGKNILGKIPFEEIEYNIDGSETKPVSAKSKVGRHIKFIPKEVEKQDDKYIVKCSRRDAQKECYDNFISKLVPGDIIPAKIVRIENYGVFCDIGCGIIALLTTNNLSVTHINNPREILRDISRLNVVVKNIDENHRIQLTHKELLGTWEENTKDLKSQDIVYGAVISVEDYGVFIRLNQNLSGLAEVPNIELEPGNMVSVKINNILPDNMKVKLTIIERLPEEEPESLKFDYKITEGHIKEWHYSTETAKKQIETYFS